MAVDVADMGFVPVDVFENTDELRDLPAEVIERRLEAGVTAAPKGPEFGAPGQAKAALASEAVEGGITFEFDGETYTVPSMDDWDLDLYDAMESNLSFRIPRLLLTPEQMGRFKSEPDPDNPGARRRKKRTPKDAEALFEAVFAAIGSNRGE